MTKNITIEISPDHLYLTASQAAEQISQYILCELSLINRLKCYSHYLFEPAFIKEHISSIMEDAPFFIGTVFQIWNYLSSSLERLEAVNSTPPTKENLIRIISIPLNFAQHHKVTINNGRYLPPSLQKVFMLLKRTRIDLGEISPQTVIFSKEMLKNTTSDMNLASSVAAAYKNHNISKHLAFTHLNSGHIKTGFYYGEQACNHLTQGFSLEETLLTCDALLQSCDDAATTITHPILNIKARIKFILGEYRVSLKIYQSLTNDRIKKSTRYESMRKVVRCYERLNEYQKAIDIGIDFLSQIDDAYYTAKMQRVLGWTYIQLGETKHLEKAISISNAAKIYFESYNTRDATYNLARTYNNIGVAHEQFADKATKNRHQELIAATTNHSKCKKIMHRLASLRWESASQLNLSIVQRKNNNLDESLKLASEAIRIKTWTCDFDDLPICQYNIAMTHLKKHFSNKNLESITQALNNINQAIEYRINQGTNKRIFPLLCLKVICEILFNPQTIQSNSITQLLELQSFSEDDKIPLFHKTLAIIYLCQKKPLPKNIDRVAEELELPKPEEILEHCA